MIGVYFLKYKGEIQYIGQSFEVEKRVKNHRAHGRIPFDEYSVMECELPMLNHLEREQINKHIPPYNKKFYFNIKPYEKPLITLDFSTEPTLLSKLREEGNREGFTHVKFYIMKSLEKFVNRERLES